MFVNFPFQLLGRFGFASLVASLLYPIATTVEMNFIDPHPKVREFNSNLGEEIALAIFFEEIPAYLAMTLVGFPLLLLLIKLGWTSFLAFALTGGLCLSVIFFLVYEHGFVLSIATFSGAIRFAGWIGAVQGLILRSLIGSNSLRLISEDSNA